MNLFYWAEDLDYGFWEKSSCHAMRKQTQRSLRGSKYRFPYFMVWSSDSFDED